MLGAQPLEMRRRVLQNGSVVAVVIIALGHEGGDGIALFMRLVRIGRISMGVNYSMHCQGTSVNGKREVMNG